MSQAQGLAPELAIVLGVVEGLTEYLPVSSTGHLIIAGHLLGFTGAIADSVEVSIQLGAILAVVAYERRKIASLITQAIREQRSLLSLWRSIPSNNGWEAALGRSIHVHRSLWFLIGLGVAFLPAALVGVLAHEWIEAHLFMPTTVAWALIVGGVIILWVEATSRRAHVTQLDDVGVVTAWWVGLAQCFALIPGVSRSGATIIGGLLAGMNRKVATEYSFFLALPTMTVATTYKMTKSVALMTQGDLLSLALGLAVSFLVAWAVIAAFLAFVKQHSLRAFAYYRIVLGIIVLMIFS
jgi:undecaprenyl-diphosphatase